MKARVYVRLKRGVLDPQGQAVAQALSRLGFAEVKDVRIGKLIELEIDLPESGPASPPPEERQRLEEMCRRLLHNPVLEDFVIEYGE